MGKNKYILKWNKLKQFKKILHIPLLIREKVSNLTYAMHISTHCPKYLQITCTKCCAASPRCVALTNKGGLTNAMTGGWVKTYPLQLYAWNIQVIRLRKCS